MTGFRERLSSLSMDTVIRKLDNAALAADIDEQEHPEVIERFKSSLRDLPNELHIREIAEGVVVNEDGHEMEDVQVRVRRRWMSNPLAWE